MKKLTLACGVFFVLGGTSAWAAPLTIPNAFSANTQAVADEVNANFTATKTAVDDNDSRITTNAASISTNSGNVTTNTSNITANTSDIATNMGNISAATHARYTDTEAQTAAAAPIATHSGNVSAHHTRYADTEAQAAAAAPINTHALIPNAHHTKYTDAEAQSAAATPIATHTADAAAHHARYTDAEAFSAVLASGGSGSTLDADLLDGQDSTAFAANIHTHTESDITDLGNCPIGEMAKVGAICVDIYEAYVTEDAAGAAPAATNRCSFTGNDCSATDNTGTPGVPGAPTTGPAGTSIFAQSTAGVTPSTGFTWFQAQQACANVGKRLLTNAEWQMAASGTPDDGTCVAGGSGIGVTGDVAACISNFGVVDMVGRVNELVADWASGEALEGQATEGANFGGDRTFAKAAAVQLNGSVNMPAAVLRGGSHNTAAGEEGVFFYIAQAAPSYSDAVTGFRCAR